MNNLTNQYLQKQREFREKNKREALTRLWVLFTDGNDRVFYAYDLKNGERTVKKGIQHFERMLFGNNFKGKWKEARIYYNNDKDGNPIHKYEFGIRIF